MRIEDRFKRPDDKKLYVPARKPGDPLPGPEIPANVNLHPEAVIWYQAVREEPVAQAFSKTDWIQVIDIAKLRTEVESPDLPHREKAQKQAEIRQREDRLFLSLSTRTKNVAVVDPAENPLPRTSPVNMSGVDYGAWFKDAEEPPAGDS
ncbi:hypothetical protein ACIBPB_30465 [Micromonospora sp. NPDC049836]|uniref:phage terminase small subunit n=1 Tax=Micromonospora sp. NPDC049836 TaxID=3364274 RepID=UPI0037935F5E